MRHGVWIEAYTGTIRLVHGMMCAEWIKETHVLLWVVEETKEEAEAWIPRLESCSLKVWVEEYK